MKILVLTSRFPYPLEKGDKLRIFNQLKVLAQNHEVILVSIADELPTSSDLKVLDEIVDQNHVFELNSFDRFRSAVTGYSKKRPFRNSYFLNNSIKRKINQLVEKEKPDHIYCHLIRMADYIRNVSIPKTIDYMDCFSLGALKRKEASTGIKSWFYGKEHELTAAYEKKVWQDFNHHTIISEQDGKALSLSKQQSVSVVKNGIDLDFFQPLDVAKKYDIGFIGNLGYYSNVKGVHYLVEKIGPQLPAETSIILAGARPEKSIINLANNHVEVTGWVEDTRTIYAAISVFVAPLFIGIGQQNKILEAMAMGIPVVATTQVNNAIGAMPEQEILIADSASDFALQIKELLKNADKYAEIRKNALHFVHENFTWAKVTQPLLDLIQST